IARATYKNQHINSVSTLTEKFKEVYSSLISEGKIKTKYKIRPCSQTSHYIYYQDSNRNKSRQ
ncbi:hypothetical protein, partial [Klebsiella grimontii]|uniref:hypothetical protein n=1 Tax=Klebsiella grimontii TaxID=2058152 RepID=UPI001D0E8FF5